MLARGHLACIGALLAAAVIAGCGAGEGSDAAEQPQLEMSAAEIAKLPPLTVPTPQGPAPRGLVVHDLRKGSGAVMKEGDTMLIAWVGIPYEEASAAAPPSPERQLEFTYGKFIEGWEKGIPGMKVGGRRELIVPPRLGDTGLTMVYVIDLLGVKPA